MGMPRTLRWTGGSGRHSTSRTHWRGPADFDLVHNHLDWLPLCFSGHFGAPMVTTIHGFSGSGILPAYRSAQSAFVSISDADRAPGLDYAATVHHGVDVSLLPFSAKGR